MIYLDSNATTRPSAGVIEAMTRCLREQWCNPSSMHRAGQQARAAMENARREVAALISAKPREITFTSSGTEAIDLAIRGLLEASPRKGASPVIITTPVEHSAVRELTKRLGQEARAEIRHIPVDRFARADARALEAMLDDRVALVSMQWANNENGAIQPVMEVSKACHARSIPLHVDGTQWVGKLPCDVSGGWCDVLTFSAHKFHGPKGVGMLWASRGTALRPTILGSQELGRRGGTENVPGIVGAGEAAKEARAWLADASARDRAGSLRDLFESLVRETAPDAVCNSPEGGRVWNTANISFPGLESEAILLLLSERGVCASAGSACSSGALEPSAVIKAMNLPDDVAHGAVRFSLCKETTEAEVREAAKILGEVLARLKASWSAVERG